MNTTAKADLGASQLRADVRLRDMLVVLDNSRQSDIRLNLAIDIAKSHGTYLRGLHVLDAVASVEAIREQEEAQKKFESSLKEAGLTGDWHYHEGVKTDAIVHLARHVDLTVLGQENPDDPLHAEWGDTVQAVLSGSGRPLLVIPYAGEFTAVGKKVLIGWKESREAARAVNDGLALMNTASSVIVFMIGSEDHRVNRGEGDSLVEHLSRHGITAKTGLANPEDFNVGDMLLDYAADIGADLLVIGGYSHSPTREFVLGGVTRTILRFMTLPVLLSH